MIGISALATYICGRYKAEYGVDIDEMKLHKLLYFAQRECMIQRGEPITNDCFEAWRYGPVSPVIHSQFRHGLINSTMSLPDIDKYMPVLDMVFRLYAHKSSWSLSTLSHGECSWRNARQGVAYDCNSTNKLQLADIEKDADRIRLRRYLFQ